MIRRANIESAKNLAAALLGIVGVVSLGVAALAVPNLLVGLGGLAKAGRWLANNTKTDQEKVKQSLYYLKRKGYISFQSNNSGVLVRLTGQGRDRLRKLQALPQKIQAPDKWDGKWWLVASDVPTKSHRQGSELLRKKLKQLGFYPFQRSLWLHPFDPRSELQWLVDYFQISRFVTVVEVSRLDKQDESEARKHFKKIGIRL